MLQFKSIPAFYAAAGIRGVTVTTLEHLWQEVGQDVVNFNLLLASPARLAESTFPTGGRVGSRADEISRSFIDRKPMLAHADIWVKADAPVEASPMTITIVVGKSYCLTGAGPLPRPELEAAIRAAGGLVHSSVTGKTDFLIMADKTSVSGKAKKAQAAGTQLLNYADVF